jgi:hypothetical protein
MILPIRQNSVAYVSQTIAQCILFPMHIKQIKIIHDYFHLGSVHSVYFISSYKMMMSSYKMMMSLV